MYQLYPDILTCPTRILRYPTLTNQVHYLVAGANGVRRLVRIKIADDNDLEQARVALVTTMTFFKRLQAEATKVTYTHTHSYPYVQITIVYYFQDTLLASCAILPCTLSLHRLP